MVGNFPLRISFQGPMLHMLHFGVVVRNRNDFFEKTFGSILVLRIFAEDAQALKLGSFGGRAVNSPWHSFGVLKSELHKALRQKC